MNSWQQPVSGEPSLGTPHSHYVLALNTNPADTVYHSLDLSGECPVGAGGVFILMRFLSNTAGHSVSVSNADGGDTYLIQHLQDATSANTNISIAGFVPVDSNRYIWWRASNVAVTDLVIWMLPYFI